MRILVLLRRLLRQTAVRTVGPVVWVCLVAYFAYYAVYGERGLMAMRQLETQVVQAKAQFDTIHEERARLDNRTALLRPDNLDLDMLDERARLMLNYSHPDDVVIALPHTGTPQPKPGGTGTSPSVAATAAPPPATER